MPEVVGVNPAAVGAGVALPAVFDKRWDLVIADAAFGKAAFVPLCLEGFRVDVLGVLDDGWLLMGEVKNMEGVGGPADLGFGDVAERARVLGDLLRGNSALLSAYNGGRLPGGGEGLKLLYGEPGVDVSRLEEDLRPRRGEVCCCRGQREEGCGVCVRRLAGPATG